MTFYYFRDDKLLAATIKIQIVTKGDTSVLTIKNVQQNASGVYKAVAKNNAGEITHTAKIDITGINNFPLIYFVSMANNFSLP